MDNLIDKILYINLDHRKDRDISIRSQLKIYKLKGERLSASCIKDNPEKGCALSHIRCLEDAINNNYKNILILEDDFVFSIDPEEFKSKIETFFKKIKKWDVLMLVGFNVISERYDDDFNKVIESNTAAGYLVNNHYYKKLLNNFKESLNTLDNSDIDKRKEIDCTWKELQKVDNWFIFNPFAGIQGCTYSNLTKKTNNLFKQTYIRCNLNGQLGNELFEMANAYYLSKKYGKCLVISGKKYGLDKIYHSFNNKINNSAKYRKRIINEPDSYEPIILKRNENIILNGYFQSDKYFNEIKDEIIDLFYLNDVDSKILVQLCLKYDINDNSVSIHIRRGDYLLKKNQELFSIIPLCYYKDCIKYFGNNRKYIIFSNDIEWCKNQELFQNLPNKTFVIEKDYIELFMMSRCKDNIISNSTFSWWGAYLNKNKNKKVMMPNRWFNINDKRHVYKDLVPKNWIISYIKNITFVTAFFNVKNKYDSIDVYYEWMKNTLNMNYCFVIYILKNDIDTKKHILNIRSDKLSITKIIEIDFNDFYVNKYDWDKQSLMDKEKYHNKYLYMIWNEKTNFLYQTVIENPFNSEIFFWIDIGYIRYVKHPYYYSNLQIEKIPKDKTLFQEIYDKTEKKYSIIGGMFGGYAQPIKKWKNLFYKKLDDYYNENKFCGKDQNIMKDVVENYPVDCHVIKPLDFYDWHYFIWYLNDFSNFFENFIIQIKYYYNKYKIPFIIFTIFVILIIFGIIYLLIIKFTKSKKLKS